MAARREFTRVASDPFEVYFQDGLGAPAELDVRLLRFPRRISAYWNGCPYPP